MVTSTPSWCLTNEARDQAMNNRNIAGITALCITALLWAWTLGWFSGKKYSDDPKVAELEKLVDKNAPKLDQMSEDEKRAGRDDFRQRMQGLTPEQRQAVMEGIMPMMVPMMAKQFEVHYDEFMKKSREEQRKELDKRIDEMESQKGKGGGPPGGMRDMDPAKAEAFRKKMLDWTTPDQRAKFENGIRLFNERRAERGLPPIQAPGRGGAF
jgi:hypothetical protein